MSADVLAAANKWGDVGRKTMEAAASAASCGCHGQALELRRTAQAAFDNELRLLQLLTAAPTQAPQIQLPEPSSTCAAQPGAVS